MTCISALRLIHPAGRIEPTAFCRKDGPTFVPQTQPNPAAFVPLNWASGIRTSVGHSSPKPLISSKQGSLHRTAPQLQSPRPYESDNLIAALLTATSVALSDA